MTDLSSLHKLPISRVTGGSDRFQEWSRGSGVAGATPGALDFVAVVELRREASISSPATLTGNGTTSNPQWIHFCALGTGRCTIPRTSCHRPQGMRYFRGLNWKLTLMIMI